MTMLLTPTGTPIRTVAELLDRLGGVPPKRVRLEPRPGTATEQDVLEVYGREGRLCELVDGTLVEKAMGFRESCLAVALVFHLRAFVKTRKLGLVAGADGMMRISAALVRIPDVSFVSWSRLPDRRMPKEPIPALAPDLAVEIMSESNTWAEMARKVAEFFAAGTLLVWIADPMSRSVRVYQSSEQFTLLTGNDILDGGTVLPGFSLPLPELFSELDEQGL